MIIFFLQYKVKLLGDDSFCSEAMPGIASKPVTFSLKGNDAKSVTIPIVPVYLGKIQIKVSATRTATEFEDEISDTVHRDLLVVVSNSKV